MTRRELFPTIAAAAAVPPTLPALAGEASPVRAKFEEWKRALTALEAGPAESGAAAEDAHLSAHFPPLLAAETALFDEPARSDADIALKFAALGASEFSLRTDGTDIPGLMADAVRVLAQHGIEIPH